MYSYEDRLRAVRLYFYLKLYYYKGFPVGCKPDVVMLLLAALLRGVGEKVKDCGTTRSYWTKVRTLMKGKTRAKASFRYRDSIPTILIRYAPRGPNPLHITAGSAK